MAEVYRKNLVFAGATLEPDGVPAVTPEQAQAHLGADLGTPTAPVKIIDVRRADEFVGELGHIKGAQLVTLETDFAQALGSLPKDETYLFVCRSGGRSAQATAFAINRGFTQVFNLTGGMMAWNAAGFAIEK